MSFKKANKVHIKVVKNKQQIVEPVYRGPVYFCICKVHIKVVKNKQQIVEPVYRGPVYFCICICISSVWL